MIIKMLAAGLLVVAIYSSLVMAGTDQKKLDSSKVESENRTIAADTTAPCEMEPDTDQSANHTKLRFPCNMSVAGVVEHPLKLGLCDIEQASDEDVTLVINELANFTASLYQEIASKFDGENLFLSSFGVVGVLAMIYQGAAGDTKGEIQSALGISSDVTFRAVTGHLLRNLKTKADEGYTLHLANLLYIRNDFKILDDFQCNIAKLETKGFGVADFDEATRNTINEKVQQLTSNKIRDLIKPKLLSRDTKLVLLNTIYLKGDWAQQFDKEQTRNRTFHLDSKRSVQVEMMHAEGTFKTGRLADSRYLRLPYKGDKLSMFIILPNKMDGLRELQSNLQQVLANLPAPEAEPAFGANMTIRMPKFTIKSDLDLKDDLSAMSMGRMFNEGQADFSQLSSRQVFVSQMIQSSLIQVNEEGSEAASATAAAMDLRRGSAPFIADRPFIFLIRHEESRLVLFIGHVASPQPINQL